MAACGAVGVSILSAGMNGASSISRVYKVSLFAVKMVQMLESWMFIEQLWTGSLQYKQTHTEQKWSSRPMVEVGCSSDSSKDHRTNTQDMATESESQVQASRVSVAQVSRVHLGLGGIGLATVPVKQKLLWGTEYHSGIFISRASVDADYSVEKDTVSPAQMATVTTVAPAAWQKRMFPTLLCPGHLQISQMYWSPLVSLWARLQYQKADIIFAFAKIG